MIEPHPEFLTKDGKREFAVLTCDEFPALQEVLADAAELLDLRAAKVEEGVAMTVALSTIKEELGLD